MNTEEAKKIVNTWGDAPNRAIPLLTTCDADQVTVIFNKRGILTRSEKLKQYVKSIKNAIASRFNTSGRPEGVCYFIYRFDENQSIVPLYVGILESVGNTIDTLSVLLDPKKGVDRFNESMTSNGHVGKINKAIRNKDKEYEHWVQEMFLDSNPPEGTSWILKRPVFVKMETWGPDARSQWPCSCLGHVALRLEEMLRLHIIRKAGLGGSLLNRDGNR